MTVVVTLRLPYVVHVAGSGEVQHIEYRAADDIYFAQSLPVDCTTRVGIVKVVWEESSGSMTEISGQIDEALTRYCNQDGGVQIVVRGIYMEESDISVDYIDKIMYPLFNYADVSSNLPNSRKLFDAYSDFITLFAKHLLHTQAATSSSSLSILDYRLFILPRAIRGLEQQGEGGIQTQRVIGFYAHIVFPSSEIYRVLPEREQLLQGILGCNLIAMHNFRFARHFLTSCTRVLGLECSSREVLPCEESAGTSTRVIPIAMGIDLEALLRVSGSVAPQLSREDRVVLLGIDELEETRGITHKLLAFKQLLASGDLRTDSLLLVQIVICEPAAVQAKRIYELVGEINSQYGTAERVPVHLIQRTSVGMEERVGLYRKAAVYIDTHLRDVMSERASEYLAVTTKGTLILSEFSGSAISLRSAALCVNPWNIHQITQAMATAVADTDGGDRHTSMYTVKEWGRRFVDELQTTGEEGIAANRPLLVHDEVVQTLLAGKTHMSGRMLVVVGLVGVMRRVLELKKDGLRFQSEMASQLANIVKSLKTTHAGQATVDVIVYSDVHRDVLDNWAADVNVANSATGEVWLIAEAGDYVKKAGVGEEWEERPDEMKTEIVEVVAQTMRGFADSCPGSIVEKNRNSITWFYPKTMRDYGAVLSKELLMHLWAGPLLTAPAEIFTGSPGFVQVRHTALNPAAQVQKITSMSARPYDFGIVIGDFVAKDEEIYSVVTDACSPNGTVFTCTVGKKASRAAFRLQDTHDAIFLLAKISWACSSHARKKSESDSLV